jgi:restriction system protein
MSSAVEMPTYRDFILPTIRAVAHLGGSAERSEIISQIISDLDIDDDMLAITYDTNEKSVIVDRMDWGRSYAKLSGLLDSPRRKMFLLTALGREVLALDEAEAEARVIELDRGVRARRRDKPKPKSNGDTPKAEVTNGYGDEVPLEEESPESDEWRGILLRRLHALTPTGFEEFVIYLLKTYGLKLKRVGGSGDEGIDGIGLAPISPVLSSRVAVQAKRYEPGSPVSRDAVALFQRDAAAAGAERAVFVTLGRFTTPAERAATLSTPNVDLIDGTRLCDLVREQEIGIRIEPVVEERWFDRFQGSPLSQTSKDS